MRKKVSIIIPVFNSLEFTKLCLEYLKRNTPSDLYECIIVNNGSTDGTEEFLNSLGEPFKIIHNQQNLGFAKANNAAVKEAKHDLILFLNNDTIPQHKWLEPLIDEMQDATVGVAGSLLFYPDLTVQHAGVVFDYSQTPYHIYTDIPMESDCVQTARDFKAVTGASMITRKSLFLQVNGFDERYMNCGEDTDYCLKIHELGQRIRYQPKSQVTHFESRSSGRRDNIQLAKKLFNDSWHGKVEQDDLSYLVSDSMRLRINGDDTFSFITAMEQEAEISVQKQRAWLYKSAQKLKEAFTIYKDIFAGYPYDVEVLQELKTVCKLAALNDDKAMFESLINQMNFSKEYTI